MRFGIKNIRFMILAVTIALLALVVTQIYWITDAVNIKKEEYTKNIKSALFTSVYKYKNHFQKISTEPKQKTRVKVNRSVNSVNVKDTMLITDSNEVAMKIIEKTQWTKDKSSIQKSRYFIADSVNFDSVYSSIVEDEAALEINKNDQLNWKTDSVITINGIGNANFNIRKLDMLKLDSIFKAELNSFGIDYNYYLVAGYQGQDLSEFNSEEAKEKAAEFITSKDLISVEMFEADRNQTALMVYVFIPGNPAFLIGEIWWIMVISGCIIVVLIFAFYYSIKTILHQKKLSDVKNDFINNMTHELKTPISTIGLACEMLNDESIQTSEPKKKTYITMIKDENKRLGTLVESVLQSAVIERGELVLKPEKIDINELIQEVATNFNIQISKRNGDLSLKLNAAYNLLMGDPVHLSNVIFNLLDNATKYSFDAPEITISTGNTPEKIIISVTDKGIGINKEDQKKIFEKLYRIPTGNVHNVKGFGLGLSYVKAVIEKHQGEVTIDSEPGKGSTFTLSLPIYHGKEN